MIRAAGIAPDFVTAITTSLKIDDSAVSSTHEADLTLLDHRGA
jgi:hypothetical protein